jgi:hypothetical protein
MNKLNTVFITLIFIISCAYATERTTKFGEKSNERTKGGKIIVDNIGLDKTNKYKGELTFQQNKDLLKTHYDKSQLLGVSIEKIQEIEQNAQNKISKQNINYFNSTQIKDFHKSLVTFDKKIEKPKYTSFAVQKLTKTYAHDLERYMKNGSSKKGFEGLKNLQSLVMSIISESERTITIHVLLKTNKSPAPEDIIITYSRTGLYEKGFDQDFMNPPDETISIANWTLWARKGKKILSDPKKITASQLLNAKDPCNITLHLKQ